MDLSGVPHINHLLKKVRNGPYTPMTALLDITDNIPSDAVGHIIIDTDADLITMFRVIDNDPYGIENIEEEGEKNPFNFGHQNEDRHTNDDYMSEFGCGGLKEGPMFLGDKCVVYTRYVKNEEYKYMRVVLDYIKMKNRECPARSYLSSKKEISYDEYKKHNTLYECGTVVEISKILPNIAETGLEILKNSIINAYGKQFPDKVLYFNGETLKTKYELYSSKICLERKKNTTIYFNKNTHRCVCKIDWEDGDRYPNYEKNTFNKTTADVPDLTQLVNGKKVWIKLKLISTSIYGTKFDPNPPALTFEDESVESEYFKDSMPKSHVHLYRNRRYHGKLDGLCKHASDGWTNHVYHELSYKSKQINPYFGINSTKGNPTERENELTKCLKICINQHNKLLTKKKFTIVLEEPEPLPCEEPDHFKILRDMGRWLLRNGKDVELENEHAAQMIESFKLLKDEFE